MKDNKGRFIIISIILLLIIINEVSALIQVYHTLMIYIILGIILFAIIIYKISQYKEQKRLRQHRLQQLYATYKNNWQDFERLLQENEITTLYHFTDRANLQSIKENGGLYSWDYCQQNDIAIPRPGGSLLSWNLDQRKGLQNYVRLSFVKSHPMLYIARNDGRIVNPVILEISIGMIYKKETKFAIQNAAKDGVMVNGSLEQFKTIQFSIFKWRYFDLTEEEKPFYQAEVLILEKIPLEYILNINNI
jgi:hypothetical protein